MNILVAAGEPYHMGRLEVPCRLRFGGLTVAYGPGNKFWVRSPCGSDQCVIDEADVTDSLKFMLLHFKPCFPNSIQPADDLARMAGLALQRLQAGQVEECGKVLAYLSSRLSGG